MGSPGYFFPCQGGQSVRNSASSQRYFAEHWPAVLESLQSYLRETETTCLNMESAGLEKNELESILSALRESHVTELNLRDNALEFSMETLSPLLTQTQVKKLNLSKCDIAEEDVMHLMNALRDTDITDLDLSENEMELNDGDTIRLIIPALLASRLTSLNLSQCHFMTGTGASAFVEALPSTSIACLNLADCSLKANSLFRLFSNLPATSITELNLSLSQITPKKLRPLCRSLKHSNLKKLDLSENDLGDEGVELLFASLPDSRLVSLYLDNNYISGVNNLSDYLPNTMIENLSLYYNQIYDITMFSFPHFVNGSAVTTLNVGFCQLGDEIGQELMRSLRTSAVTKLDVSGNNLQLRSISEFANIVRDTVIEDVNFSFNNLSPELILILGNSLPGSRIKHFDISQNFDRPSQAGSVALSAFIASTRGTSVESLKFTHNHIDVEGAAVIAANLPGTNFTCLDLSWNQIGVGVVQLAAQLLFTAITHLDLSMNGINDEGTVALAEYLTETQITDLNLNCNSFTSRGAEALASSLRNSSLLSLHLDLNEITDSGFGELATQAENTFFNNFEGGKQGGRLLIDKFLWKNKISAHKLTRFFKKIAPVGNLLNFRFEHNLNAANLHQFPKECAKFYKLMIERPAAISVLAEENLSFSRSQISTLLHRFPEQFIAFIETNIKPNVHEFIKVLKELDELGLTEILLPLLTELPVVRIDRDLTITHPIFYRILRRYGQPQLHQFVAIAPQNTPRVIRFLSENPALEGHLDMIRIISRNEVAN